MKWGWWRGYITYAGKTGPDITFDEYLPFWALWPPCIAIKPIWWGVN